MAPPHTIVVYASKVRVALLAIALLALGGIGVFMTVSPGTESPYMTAVAGIIVALLGGVGVLTEVAIFFSPKPRLTVNREGIWLNLWPTARMLGVPFIPWDNIALLLSRRQYMQTLLLIALVDAEAVSAEQTRLQRFAFLLLTNVIGTRTTGRFRMITTADGQLATSTDEILQRIQDEFPHELKHYHIRIVTVQGRQSRRRRDSDTLDEDV